MTRIFQEKQYLKLVKNIINNGIKNKGRNGTIYTQIGGMMRFSLKDKKIPIMTTKKLAWKVCLKELLWFINGHTNNRLLKYQNVKIWNGNATREFLDSRGLHYLKEDDLGPVYGHQWRYWNAKYDKDFGCMKSYEGQGIDQLENIINDINESKITGESSRRLIMTAWNPEQIDEMALPPCHVLSQFHITEGNKLSCTLYQRSADMGLGVPFNIASYSFLTHLIAYHCGLEAKEFIHFLGNAHIYDDHIESLMEQIKKEPYEFPILNIKNKRKIINDYVLNDFEVLNYNYHPSIKMKMRV
tara:strand:- start:4878 stop:5774 length:897 start_codon:yes stop_codon:yes gene_type:complete